MRIVLETNVLVSGLLSPFGPPGEIVRMVSSSDLRLCFDARILAEYADVLARPKFGFDEDAVGALLDYIGHAGDAVAPVPLQAGLPDPFDEPFLEVALAGAASCLVTGNLVHYPKHLRQGVSVLSPSEFVGELRAGVSGGGT